VASTTGQTFVSLLAERSGLSMNDLRSVYDACKQDGANFAEKIVDWKLIDQSTVRALLLEHVALGVAHLAAWPDGDVLFVPEKRTYRGTMRFELDEVLAHARTLQNEGRLREMADRVMRVAPAAEPAPPKDAPPGAGAGERVEPARNATGPPKDAGRSGEVEHVLESFLAIHGFIGVAAFTPTGEVIAEVSSAGTRPGELGALANDVLLESQKATDLMGVGRGDQVQLIAPRRTS
jgi:hypothetical protein